MSKTDYKKELRHLYHATKEPVVVDVPPMNFLMIDGSGDPNTTPEYQHAVEALFSVSYALKFKMKKTQGVDYVVMPLEGLWWADDLSAFVKDDRAHWKWTMMIMQPDVVPAEMVDEAVAEVREKKQLPALDKLRFERFHEGRAAQVMHIGPFSEEGPTIERLHDFIRERGELTGKHHEIYLSDVRRANPKNWKTILRQPMK